MGNIFRVEGYQVGQYPMSLSEQGLYVDHYTRREQRVSWPEVELHVPPTRRKLPAQLLRMLEGT